jgi:hypothetical protein
MKYHGCFFPQIFYKKNKNFGTKNLGKALESFGFYLVFFINKIKF